MDVSQEKIVSLSNAIKDLEEQKKEITKEINTFYEDFLEENGIEKTFKKQVKDSVKEHRRWEKDRAKFTEQEYFKDSLVELLIGEKK